MRKIADESSNPKNGGPSPPYAMTERQFRQIVTNRKRRGGEVLFGGSAANSLLRDAARDARQRRSAEAAWEAIAPVELADGVRVGCVREGVVHLDVRDAAMRERVRRQVGRFLQQMRQRMAGVSALRVTDPGSIKDEQQEVD